MISREELQAAERDLERQRQLQQQLEQERLAEEAATNAAKEQEQFIQQRSTGRGEGRRAFNPDDAPKRKPNPEIQEAAMTAEVSQPNRERGFISEAGDFINQGILQGGVVKDSATYLLQANQLVAKTPQSRV